MSAKSPATLAEHPGVATDPSLTIVGAADALRAGTTTAVALVEESIARADASDAALGVYITRTDEAALEAATLADEELKAGIDRGPLHGIPFGIKDIIASTDAPTTAQSLILDPEWGPAQGDAVVVERLRASGAAFVGKAATLEFAIGIADANKPFPVHRNPWDPDCWPGGSSAGTGAGVAAGMFLGGLGTDTGGSIRIPAAFCGITGLKATYGRVPKSGCVPLGYSLDHIGPMARSAADCAAILESIAGYHPSDPTCVDRPADDLPQWDQLPEDLEGVRIGVDRANHYSAPNIADGAIAVFEEAVRELEGLGAEVVDVSIPHFAEGNAADILIMVAEAMAYHRSDFQTRWEDYGSATRETLGWSMAYTGADYVQAQRVRSLVCREMASLLTTVDAVVHPTNLFGAPRLDDTLIANWLDWPLFTSYGNSVGLPVLSAPMGFVDGMPLGLSVMTKAFDEAGALAIGHAFQSTTNHHLQAPQPTPTRF